MLVRSLCLSSIVLLTSCAMGTEGEADGVLVRADAREDGDLEPTDGSTTDEDGGAEEDTGEDETSSPDDTGAPEEDASPADTGASEDTGTPDTGPTPCSTEETEPNDTPSTARDMGTIDDCDGSGKVVAGVLSSSSDVDVITFSGTDSFGCSVNPTAKVTGAATVCIRATCKSGTTEVKSCPKGTKTGSECCGSEAEISINCTGTTSDDAKIELTVRGNASTPTCAEYSVSFHY